MSDSVRPHRWQPTRLSHPWDSPGKNAGVGCHFLLQCMKVKSESKVAQSCPSLHDPMDCRPPGSPIPGTFQARTSAISKLRAGFTYGSPEASSVIALSHNKLPALFIHGDADDFVPTAMVDENYAATKGPKMRWIVKGAKHAQALKVDKAGYYAKVAEFLAKYEPVK